MPLITAPTSQGLVYVKSANACIALKHGTWQAINVAVVIFVVTVTQT